MPEYSPFLQRMLDMAAASKGETRISATVTGKLLEVKVHEPSHYNWEHKRGVIKDFSPTARKRFLRRFQTINFADHYPPLFVTLTYPDGHEPNSKDERNIHRQVMARHLEQHTGKHVPAAWRVEWEFRKSGVREGEPTPHHHWLIFGHDYIDFRVVNKLWKKTIGREDYCRTEIRRCTKDQHILSYMAKYISKNACVLSLVKAYISQQLGRAYGWLRPESIPWHSPIAFHKLSDAQWDDLERLANEQLPWWTPGQKSSFTLCGRVAEDAGRILLGEALDE